MVDPTSFRGLAPVGTCLSGHGFASSPEAHRRYSWVLNVINWIVTTRWNLIKPGACFIYIILRHPQNASIRWCYSECVRSLTYTS